MKEHQLTLTTNPNTTEAYHMAYYEWGDSDNDKVVICVHGLSRNGRDFDHLAQSLAKDYRVIAVDIVGRGNSSYMADSSLYSYETYLHDMLVLLNKLGASSYDWVGTSMGGIIGMSLAAMQPQLIKTLIINDIGPVVLLDAMKRIVKYVGQGAYFESYEHAHDTLRTNMKTFGIQTEEHWQHIFEHSIENSDGQLKARFDKAILEPLATMLEAADHDFEMWDAWQAIEAKTFVLAGKHSDILTSEILHKMHQLMPSLVSHTLDHVGHAPALMDSEQIKLVSSWLNTR